MGATQRKPPQLAWVLPVGLTAAGALLIVAAATVGAGQPAEARLSVVGADPRVVELVLDTPAAALVRLHTADGDALGIAGEGFSPATARALPERGALVGVPPGARVRISYVVLKTATFDDPRLESRAGLPDQAAGDPAAEITDEAWLRDLRVVRVALRPVAFGPDGSLVMRERIRARLEFEGVPDLGTPRPDPHWERAYAGLVCNWAQAQPWRTGGGHQPTSDPNPLAAEGGWKIAVTQKGWQLVPVSTLVMSGLPPGAHPASVRVFDNNLEVPLFVVGGEDNRLDGGDLLLFYGWPVLNRYTDTNIYWLTVDTSDPGARIAEKAAEPGSGARPAAYTDTLRVEQNLFYDALTPAAPDEDRFYWRRLVTGADPLSATHTITFTLAGLEEGPAAVRMRLKGEDDADHRVQLTLNGALVADRPWTGTNPILIEEQLADSSALADGENTLVVDSIGSGPDSSLLDWLEIDYPHDFDARGQAVEFNAEYDATYQVIGLPDNNVQVLDVTDPAAPVVLTDMMVAGVGPYLARFAGELGHRYLVAPAAARLRPPVTLDLPADLVDPGAGADVIALSHTDFRIAAVLLRGHRFNEGFRARIVDVQDVFDTYNDGEPDPQAIRDMVARAYTGWPAPAPSYLLVIGDGHYDYRNFVTEYKWFVPPAMVEPGPGMGEFPADNQFVTVSGDDPIPDLAVGRLAVNHMTAASDAADRIRDYEQQSIAPWQQRVLMLSDAGPAGAEPGDEYSDRANEVARALPQGFTVQRVTYGELGYQTPDAVRSTVSAALGSGRALLGYVGAADRRQWSQDGIWRIDEVTALDNSSLPVVLELTGNTGYFIEPESRSIAEEFVDRGEGGAIASWASSAPYDGPGFDTVGQAWVRAVYDDGYRGGSAAVVAKAALFAAAPEREHLLHTLTWLGDPVLKVVETIPRDPPSPTPIVTAAPTGSPTPSATLTATATITPTGTLTPTASVTAGTPIATLTQDPSGSPSPTSGTPLASATPGATTSTPGPGTPSPQATPTSTVPAHTASPTSGPSPTDGPAPGPTPTYPWIPGEGSAIYIPVAYTP